MAAKKKDNPGFQAVVKYLKKRPDAPYADVKAAVEKGGHKIYPIVYGRAKALLGLVKSAPRGSGKAARKKKAAKATSRAQAATATTAKRRGRPRKVASSAASNDSITAVLGAVREMEADRDRLRAALKQIGEIIDAAT